MRLAGFVIVRHDVLWADTGRVVCWELAAETAFVFTIVRNGIVVIRITRYYRSRNFGGRRLFA